MTTSIWWRCWPARTARRPSVSWERYQVRAACLAAEQRLRAALDRARPTGPRPAAGPRGEREGRPPRPGARPPASRCGVRATAAAASRRTRAGVLRPRWTRPGCWCASGSASAAPARSPGTRSRSPATPAQDGGPIWYGGGKLAADLSWPKLRQRWTPHRATLGRAHPNLTAGAERALGARHPCRRRRHGPDPHPGLDRPGCRRRCRLGQLRHLARRRRHARQPHPAPGRRRLRPRRPRTLRPHPAAHPGREPAPASRPASVRIRLPHRQPAAHPDRAHHQAGRARRSRRRPARIPAARRPGRRRPRRR